MSWKNWAGTAVSTPARVETPASVEELAALVRRAAADGLTVKAVGSGHSFTDIAATDGVQVRLDRLTGLTRRGNEVIVGAGVPLHQLNALLDRHGLALPNLGDIDRQTISGAISTGTHGTGARLGGLATTVTGVELITARGEMINATDGDLLKAAPVGLGALGILASVTLRCVPAFTLRAQEGPMPLDAVFDGLDDLVDGNDHFEFYWFPHTTRTLTKRNNRTSGPRRPVNAFRGWLDDEILSNRVFDWTNRLCTARPGLTPKVNNLATRMLTPRTYTDKSHRVFCSPRRVIFTEMEYAVPRAAVTTVLHEIKQWTARSGENLPFPIEVRFAAPDDLWLSTGYGRANAYIAVHQYHRLPHERYFAAVEAIAVGAGGRPHWGKLHSRTAADLAEVYPRFGDFVALRDRLDPDRVFVNPYLDRVLG